MTDKTSPEALALANDDSDDEDKRNEETTTVLSKKTNQKEAYVPKIIDLPYFVMLLFWHIEIDYTDKEIHGFSVSDGHVNVRELDTRRLVKQAVDWNKMNSHDAPCVMFYELQDPQSSKDKFFPVGSIFHHHKTGKLFGTNASKPNIVQLANTVQFLANANNCEGLTFGGSAGKANLDTVLDRLWAVLSSCYGRLSTVENFAALLTDLQQLHRKFFGDVLKVPGAPLVLRIFAVWQKLTPLRMSVHEGQHRHGFMLRSLTGFDCLREGAHDTAIVSWGGAVPVEDGGDYFNTESRKLKMKPVSYTLFVFKSVSNLRAYMNNLPEMKRKFLQANEKKVDFSIDNK